MRNLLLLLLLFAGIPAWSTNYYLHSSIGSDQNSGKSMETPWKSIEKLNAEKFQPGDSIFLSCNSVWFEHLKLKGSGKKGKPIVLTSYGSGYMPLLIGKGLEGEGTVNLYNQSFWEISNLEITNDAPEPGDRRGVEIKASNYGLAEHIYLRNLYIHHIKGIPGDENKFKRTAGIYVVVEDNKKIPTRFHDVLIEGCLIHHADNQGIALANEKLKAYPGEGDWEDCKFTQVIVRNNVIHHISKNAMIIRMTEKGLIENNVCFETAMKTQGNTMFSRSVSSSTFQYNEGFRNLAHAHDGCMYDPDLASLETYWQYSYSHDNAHGLAWFCTEEKDKIYVRNNISQNDKGYLVYLNYAYKESEVSGNIFYAGKTVQPYLIYENASKKHGPSIFKKNVVFNESDKFTFEFNPDARIKKGVNVSNRKMESNIYLGTPLINPLDLDMGKAPNNSGLNNLLKFHRGFVKSDAIDKLTNHKVDVFVPEKNNDIIVATINNVPVYRFELEREMRRVRPLVLAESQTKFDEKACREKAMQALVAIKVQEQWMNERKMPEGKIIPAIEQLREKENTYRKNNLNNKDIIIIGPRYFAEDGFWDYFFANAIEALKKEMWNKELAYTEAELKEHYLTGDLDRTTPRWSTRSFDYYKNAVVRSLVDKKYNELLTQKIQQAVVTQAKDNILTEQEKKEGWKLLWDGKTSNGWRSVKSDNFPEKGWLIQNGELIGLKAEEGKKRNGGDIITIEKFGNFELVVDFKLTPLANTGIKYFVDLEMSKGKGAVGCEYQLIDDYNHPLIAKNPYGLQTTASLYDLIPTDPGKKNIYPVGSWNQARIVSKNNKVEHWLNGIKVLEYERGNQHWKKLVETSKFKEFPGFGEVKEGHILLQDHGDQAYFKNIKIRKI